MLLHQREPALVDKFPPRTHNRRSLKQPNSQSQLKEEFEFM